MRAVDRREDIPQLKTALDNERRHQVFEGAWTEVHPFAVDEMRLFRGGVKVKTISFSQVKPS